MFLALSTLLLTACGGKETKKDMPASTTETSKVEEKKEETTEEKSTEEKKEETVEMKKKVVTATTSFLYDMTKQLAGDLVERQLIIPAGEDPHLYVAKPEDLKKLQSADLVLYHGLHFEGKMVDVLEKLGTNLSKNFPEDKIGKMEEDGETVIDPHFWFDLDLYKMAAQNAGDALVALLPEHADEIKKNTEAYLAELTKLDEENKAAMEMIPAEHRYLITPHDAFNYFSKRYNIEVVAPQGVSTDSEVANKDLDDTVNFIVEHKVKAIFAESTTDPARMEKLKEACKAKGFDVKVVSGEGNELFSDSLAPEGEDGESFVDMYRHNVKLITENLK